MTYTIIFNIGEKNGNLKGIFPGCRLNAYQRGVKALSIATDGIDPAAIKGCSVRVDGGTWQGRAERTAIVSVVLNTSSGIEIVKKLTVMHADTFCHRFDQEAVAWVVSDDNPLVADEGGLEWNSKVDDDNHLDFDFAYFIR